MAAIDVDSESARATADEIGGVAGVCDVSDAEDVRRLVRELERDPGPPDVLVCAAGVGHTEPAAGHGEESWRRVLDVNLTGPFHFAREVLGGMCERGWGRIVNISSGSGVRPGPATGAYGASKAGLIALTKSIAYDGAEHGVTANCIAPGLVDTAMTRRLMPTDEMMAAAAKKSRAASPIGKPLQPEDIAHAVAFLCTPESWGITGQTLHVNAGALMP